MESYIGTPQGAKFLKQYLDKFNGKSSQKIYKSEIRQFFKFYPGTLGDLGKKDFTRYLNHLGKTSKAKTIKRKFSILNQCQQLLNKLKYSVQNYPYCSTDYPKSKTRVIQKKQSASWRL